MSEGVAVTDVAAPVQFLVVVLIIQSFDLSISTMSYSPVDPPCQLPTGEAVKHKQGICSMNKLSIQSDSSNSRALKPNHLYVPPQHNHTPYQACEFLQ